MVALIACASMAGARTRTALPDMATTLREQRVESASIAGSLGHSGAEPRGDRLYSLQSRFADEAADGGGHPATSVGWQAVP
jgi:hypothetical protein